MTIKILLTALLLGVFFYALVALNRARLVALTSALLVLGGLYFVWFPDMATRLAHLVGVGRGADLVIYIALVLGLLAILDLHLHLRKRAEETTELARRLAIFEAERAQGTDGAGIDRDV